MKSSNKWTEKERSAANDINRELFNNIVLEFPHLTDFDHAKTLGIDLQCEVTALHKALQDITAIENKTDGGDRDEIEEARDIASSCLEKCK